MNNSKHFQFTLPIMGQVLKSSEKPRLYGHLTVSGIAFISEDGSLSYRHSSKHYSGDSDALIDFNDEMKGKKDDQTALHLATMNHISYLFGLESANVLDVDCCCNFSMINKK